MYVTPPQLADNPGSLELAQVASAQHQSVIDATLMELTLRGGDRTSYSSDAIAQADDAMTRISNEISLADSFIDGFLARRYPLPLSSTPGILTTWARAIVRYKLHKDQISDVTTNPIARDYKEAVGMLQLVADGKFSLGIDDPESAANGASNVVQFDAGDRRFDRRSREHNYP